MRNAHQRAAREMEGKVSRDMMETDPSSQRLEGYHAVEISDEDVPKAKKNEGS